MTRKFFGTDGIRGLANGHKLTSELALKVGQAAGSVFQRGDHRHRVVIGKDTRRSGYMIEYALTAGFNSVGMDVFLLGPMPTPAVAMLTRSLRADLGVMISASHNPYDDNGIKLFQPDGFKLTDDMEGQIEELLNSELADELVRGREIGRAHRIEEARGRYSEYAKRTLPRLTEFNGLRVVVDCANGAAYKSAPEVLGILEQTLLQLVCRQMATISMKVAGQQRHIYCNKKCAKRAQTLALRWMVTQTAWCWWTKKARSLMAIS